jgi:hypothetical protein
VNIILTRAPNFQDDKSSAEITLQESVRSFYSQIVNPVPLT